MTEKQIERLLKNQQLSEKALVEKVEAYTTSEKAQLDELLSDLLESGIIGKKDSFYYLLKDQGVFLAKVIVKNRNFVILKSVSDSLEVKISGYEADQLLIGDLVYAKEFQQNIYHCLDYYRSVSTLKGTYSLTSSGKEMLVVDYLNDCGKKVIITDKSEIEVNQGDLLEGQLTSFEGDVITVKIIKKLVAASDVGADISMIIASNDARLEFSSSVLEEAKKIPMSLSEEDYKDRTDYRKHCVVTIDGDDAKDFDDAVEAKRDGKGYEIIVHIADVTHYVKPNHPLDDEARLRGTSIYVADRVVPMLPFELSNEICSLNPNVDRLTLSVTMQVTAMGDVFYSEVKRGVIKSSARLTYNKVNNFFETGEYDDVSNDVKDTLRVLKEASKAIRRKRSLQGALKLDSTELKYHLDENDNPFEVIKMKQGEAEMMIEDLMIIANCSIAKMLKENNVPVLYRVHEFPPLQKIAVLKDYLKRLNLLREFPKTENITGARLNDFLNSIENEDIRSSVSYMILRSMAKARYSTEEIGHFGLAELEYCHFTSPIRRYPDDIIHRLVKDYIIDKKSVDFDSTISYLDRMGETLSDLENKADIIQRDVDDLEASKYMANHIGELYHGKVTGMVQRGMFIETELGIEGFLAFHCMHGDHFKYNEKAFCVFGKMTDISFTIGTKVDVKVLASNPEKREIDFATPEFYDAYAVDLSEKERESLSLDGINLGYDDEYMIMTGKPTFSYRDNSGYGDRMNNDELNENVGYALSSLDDDSFKPTLEQWKEVDIIRAVKAKYPDDEDKVIQVLSVMDISEEEYRKLLRFTKPKNDKKRSGNKFSRSSNRGRSSFSNTDRRDNRRSSSRGKSFSSHKGYSRRNDRGNKKGR